MRRAGMSARWSKALASAKCPSMQRSTAAYRASCASAAAADGNLRGLPCAPGHVMLPFRQRHGEGMARILTIEDDAVTAREIVAELSAAGNTVEHVGDGHEGLHKALTGGYDA